MYFTRKVKKMKTTAREYVLRTLVTGKKGDLVLKPDFADHGIYFYPIPSRFQRYYKEGDKIWGFYGKTKDTGKKDINGKRIFVRPFIPK